MVMLIVSRAIAGIGGAGILSMVYIHIFFHQYFFLLRFYNWFFFVYAFRFLLFSQIWCLLSKEAVTKGKPFIFFYLLYYAKILKF